MILHRKPLSHHEKLQANCCHDAWTVYNRKYTHKRVWQREFFMIEVEVHSIRVSLMNQQRVVLLKDLHDERYLAIWIGQFEAEAITIELRNTRSISRPLTHDLLKNAIESMGGEVRHILVNDMRNEVYYARIVIDVDGETQELDARPSDAMALAVRCKAPIFVADAVMTKHGIQPEEEVNLGADADFDFEDYDYDDDDYYLDEEPETLERIDESQFSAFSDFVNSLDLDELDDDD